MVRTYDLNSDRCCPLSSLDSLLAFFNGSYNMSLASFALQVIELADYVIRNIRENGTLQPSQRVDHNYCLVSLFLSPL